MGTTWQLFAHVFRGMFGPLGGSGLRGGAREGFFADSEYPSVSREGNGNVHGDGKTLYTDARPHPKYAEVGIRPSGAIDEDDGEIDSEFLYFWNTITWRVAAIVYFKEVVQRAAKRNRDDMLEKYHISLDEDGVAFHKQLELAYAEKIVTLHKFESEYLNMLYFINKWKIGSELKVAVYFSEVYMIIHDWNASASASASADADRSKIITIILRNVASTQELAKLILPLLQKDSTPFDSPFDKVDKYFDRFIKTIDKRKIDTYDLTTLFLKYLQTDPLIDA